MSLWTTTRNDVHEVHKTSESARLILVKGPRKRWRHGRHRLSVEFKEKKKRGGAKYEFRVRPHENNQNNRGLAGHARTHTRNVVRNRKSPEMTEMIIGALSHNVESRLVSRRLGRMTTSSKCDENCKLIGHFSNERHHPVFRKVARHVWATLETDFWKRVNECGLEEMSRKLVAWNNSPSRPPAGKCLIVLSRTGKRK